MVDIIIVMMSKMLLKVLALLSKSSFQNFEKTLQGGGGGGLGGIHYVRGLIMYHSKARVIMGESRSYDAFFAANFIRTRGKKVKKK